MDSTSGLSQPKTSFTTVESIQDLPEELLTYVFSVLDPKESATVSLVCHSWNNLTNDDLVWKMRALTLKYDVNQGAKKGWKEFVHRSIVQQNCENYLYGSEEKRSFFFNKISLENFVNYLADKDVWETLPYIDDINQFLIYENAPMIKGTFHGTPAISVQYYVQDEGNVDSIRMSSIITREKHDFWINVTLPYDQLLIDLKKVKQLARHGFLHDTDGYGAVSYSLAGAA
ncbi:MAG: hypothetical protein K940chlam3_00527 [Chlamydiae bacterium]|nr:hypothetical protein [Chlamydiota bacterium]